ncbi:MAG: porin family protein [Sandarakinorhabdus sp.]|nr:porin family protein [Sandarakinorhabdus sp.]
MWKYLFALAAVAAAGSALAQQAPAAFNGPFVGIQGGWQQDRQTLLLNNGGIISEVGQNKSGFGYGGQIGYDFRLSPAIVLGAEVDLTGRTGTSRVGGAGGYDLKQGRTIAATARLGYLVTPESLLYVRGGYANGRFTLSNATISDSTNRDGYQVGVGYEQLLRQNLSARVEYTHSGFGTENIFGLAQSIGATDANLKYSRNAVRAGLNLRF